MQNGIIKLNHFHFIAKHNHAVQLAFREAVYNVKKENKLFYRNDSRNNVFTIHFQKKIPASIFPVMITTYSF